jgi:hypothetical protein
MTSGRSPVRRPATVLYAMLKAVAEEAARRTTPPKQPHKVTVGEWKRARPALEPRFGHIPLPQEVRRQLQIPGRAKEGWRVLLERACSGPRKAKRIHEILASEPDRDLDERDYVFSLLFVAHRLGDAGLTPDSYQATRERLLAAVESTAEREDLARRLLTHGQIIRAAGSWDAALRNAGLGPRYVDGLPRRRPKKRAVTAKKAKAEALLPGVWSEKYSRTRVIEHVQEFLKGLPRGTSPTGGRWRSFVSDSDTDRPSEWVIDRHGGLPHLVEEALRPDWRERARKWEAKAEKVRKQRREELLAKRRATEPRPTQEGIETRVKILQMLNEHGELGTSTLVKMTGLSRIRVQQVTGEFVRCGYVRRTQEYARSPNQTYIIEAKGRRAMKSERMLVEGYQQHGGRAGRRGRRR